MIVCTTMELLAEYLGIETALRLVETLGGCDIVVPKGQTGVTWDRLVRAIGEDEARRMTEIFGGEKLYIPLNRAGWTAAKREWVRMQRAAGRSIDEIADEAVFGQRHTRRWVRRMLAATDEMARQMDKRQLELPWVTRKGKPG